MEYLGIIIQVFHCTNLVTLPYVSFITPTIVAKPLVLFTNTAPLEPEVH